MFPATIGARVQLGLAVILGLSATALTGEPQRLRTTAPAATVEIGLPLSFELNEGQAPPAIRALTRGKGYGLLLTDTETVLVTKRNADSEQTVFRFRTIDSNPAPAVTGLDALPGTVSYFVGNDPAKWRSGIRTYAKIKYASVYRGIDAIYYGKQGQLEYDFVVAPGADPSAIRLAVSGADTVRLNEAGDLVLETTHGTAVQHKPVLYQDVDGERRAIDGRFVLRAGNEVSFEVGSYDHAHALIIDPSLGFFTYFGGTGTDEIRSIAVSSPSGLTFFGGFTTSPTLPSAYNSNSGGNSDAFVAAMGSNATSVLLTIFLGGTGTDVLNGLALDPASVPSFLAVAGVTNSTDFPILGAAQSTVAGNYDGFVTKFNIALSNGVPSATLAFSTYLGGSNVDAANSVAVGNAATGSPIFVAGSTLSTDFPVANAYQASNHGGWDAFVTKYRADGTVAYSTYWGGKASEGAMGIAVYNRSLPTPAAIPVVSGTLTIPGGSLALVFSLDPTGATTTYGKVIGAATAVTTANAVAVDNSGNAYIAGKTNDRAFPLVNPVQATYGGNTDAYVVEVDGSGNTVFATYYGGAGFDYPYSIAVDTFTGGNNNIVIGGVTTGSFPATAIQTTFGGGESDGFVVLLKGGTGYTVGYATYLGGTGADVVFSVCVGSAHNARAAGLTSSPGLATSGIAQPAIAGGYDGFVAKLNTTP